MMMMTGIKKIDDDDDDDEYTANFQLLAASYVFLCGI